MKKFHPDRFSNHNDPEVTRKTQLVTELYDNHDYQELLNLLENNILLLDLGECKEFDKLYVENLFVSEAEYQLLLDEHGKRIKVSHLFIRLLLMIFNRIMV